MRLSIVALQSKIDELGVALAEATAAAARPDGNATFDTVTCKKWKVVDDSGKERIIAKTTAIGAGITWYDKDETARIDASTLADGTAVMKWYDKDEKERMSASTFADGRASMDWFDKDGKSRIGASTKTDGTVTLPTTDLKPKP